MKASRLWSALGLTLALVAVFGLAPAAVAGEDGAQQKAEAILKRADEHVASLRDFKANLKARAHISLLPAVDLTGRIFFKRPNHLKVEMDNLPRMARRLKDQMQVDPPYQNRKLYAPRYLRAEAVDGRMCDVIAFQARTAATKLQTATIWLERASQTIPMTNLDYADGSHATMKTTYGRVQSYLLPRTSDVSMSLTSMHIEAEVTYSDYVLNSNIPDATFARKPLPSP